MPNHKEVLFETEEGTVQIKRTDDRLQINYGPVSIEQSLSEFNYFNRAINSLYKYVKEVRQIYYKKFLVQISQYKLNLILNSKEIIELYELLGGAKTMLEWEEMINNILESSSNENEK